MNDINNWRWENSETQGSPAANDFGKMANDVCEKALSDAKAQLHPLLRDVELERLEERSEFLQAFKSALEQQIARKVATWQPGVQAVFQFDESPGMNRKAWDGSIHLLVKIPRLSNALKILGRRLDRNLVKYFKRLDWPRFGQRQSILEIQQVTPNEIRRGISYGAMFSAVYNIPVRVWPRERRG